MEELEKTALNEILRTVTYIADKVGKLEERLSPQLSEGDKNELKDAIIQALSQGKGIVDYGVGSKRGPVGGRLLSNDERKALGFPEITQHLGQRGTS